MKVILKGGPLHGETYDISEDMLPVAIFPVQSITLHAYSTAIEALTLRTAQYRMQEKIDKKGRLIMKYDQ